MFLLVASIKTIRILVSVQFGLVRCRARSGSSVRVSAEADEGKARCRGRGGGVSNCGSSASAQMMSTSNGCARFLMASWRAT